jgi:hypothetical protein
MDGRSLPIPISPEHGTIPDLVPGDCGQGVTTQLPSRRLRCAIVLHPKNGLEAAILAREASNLREGK